MKKCSAVCASPVLVLFYLPLPLGEAAPKARVRAALSTKSALHRYRRPHPNPSPKGRGTYIGGSYLQGNTLTVQSLIQISLQIFHILDAHRQPAQRVGDAELRPRRGGNAGVGHDRRMLDQAFHAAQRFRQGENFAAFEEAARILQAAL